MRNITLIIAIVLLATNLMTHDSHDNMFSEVPKVAMGPAINYEQGYIVEALGNSLFVINDDVFKYLSPLLREAEIKKAM